MSEVLELANRLRDLSDDDLAGLLRERAISPHNLRDFFDLAEAMLQTKNAEAWLASLNLDELAEVAGSQTSSPFAEIASLVFHSASSQRADFGEKFRDYLDVLQSAVIAEGKKTIALLKAAEIQEGLTTSTPTSDGSGYAQAGIRVFETIQALTEVIYDLEQHRVRSVGKAGVASAEVKRLSIHLSVDPENVKQIFQLAQYCDLIALEGERWALTTNSQHWIDWSIEERWLHLVKFFLMLVGENGAAMFRRRWNELESTTFTNFLSTVYLSIVTPGPLSSTDERAIRQFVETEQVGIASRMRITPLSLMTALETGVSIEEIRATLLRLSNGTIPQPVEYLLNDTAKKYGRIQISDSGQGSIVNCSDDLLAAEILHESVLRPFALELLDSKTLRTKYDSDVVYFGLREAGHLAIRVDASGKTIPPMKTASLHQRSSLDTVRTTIERLREADARVTEAGDDESMLRQIQLAIKNRASVKVNYRGKDGSEYEFVLEPIGLANGRLRGKDRRADIERTLTLSNITKLSLV